MNTEDTKANSHFLLRWMRSTFFGYLIGFVLILIGSMLGDLAGSEGPGSDFVIGIGMGLGVGYMQGRVLRQWLGVNSRWMWASVIGMGAPLVAEDIIAALWSEFGDLHTAELDIMICGLLTGILQRQILREHSEKANWWIPISLVGWTLAAWVASITVVGEWDGLINLGAILSGGVIIGVVGGGGLVWILRSQVAKSGPERAG